MAENTKRYYWLKLKDDFFDEKYVKALRKLPQGDSLTIVYLKMQLKSLKTEGIIKYEGIMPDAMTELALLLDEDENVVRLAVEALIRFGVVERWDNDTFYLVQLQHLIGSETQSAERVRKHRALKKAQDVAAIGTAQTQEMLQCNAYVTECNTEKEKDREIDEDIENKEEEEKKKNSKKGASASSSYDDLINSTLWSDAVKDTIYEFIKMRKLIKKPMTDYALKKMLNKLERLSNGSEETAIAILDKSITNNWQDIFELKADTPKKASAPANSGNIFLDIAEEEGIF